jgi:hypothetical protein
MAVLIPGFIGVRPMSVREDRFEGGYSLAVLWLLASRSWESNEE